MLAYRILRNESTSQWLTLVHGASASASIWKYQIEFFKKYYNVLILDFNGYSEDTTFVINETSYSFELLASEVVKIMREENIKSSHFIGASLGNIIVRQIMETDPQCVNAVVMTSAVLHLNFMATLVLYSCLFLEKIIPHKYLYKFSVAISFPMPSNKPSRQLFLESMDEFSREMYRLWLKLAKENFALMHFFNLVGLRSDVLFVNGNQDYLFLPYIKKFVRENETAELKIIQNGGHGINIDKKEIYNKEVLMYLRKVDSTQRYSSTVYAY